MIELVGRSLHQWDIGRKVVIVPLDDVRINEVHFANKGDTKALVVKTAVGDSGITADIPNILLQTGKDLVAYAVSSSDTAEHTEFCKYFCVTGRVRPDDYVYAEEAVYSLKALVETIRNGAGENSLVIGVGDASGDHSIAGGTNDKQMASDILGYDISLIPDSLIKDKLGQRGVELKEDVQSPAEANGDICISYGSGTNAITAGSMALGLATKAGSKGFYWHKITFGTSDATIALSTKQAPYMTYKGLLGGTTEKNTSSSWDSNAGTVLSNWEVGDKLNIIIKSHYPMCCEIKTIDTATGVIIVSALPFTSADLSEIIHRPNSIDYTAFVATLMPQDFTICNPLRPEHGVVNVGYGAVAQGFGTVAAGTFSQAYGNMSVAASNFAHAEGRNTVAAYASHAEGVNSKALGDRSHAEGSGTEASGKDSHAEGVNGKALGISSHAEGGTTVASGDYSHAEGAETVASGAESHAEGWKTTSSGKMTHAEGYNTVASSEQSHAEGNNTSATGKHSHSEGCQTQANGGISHAEGYLAIASGEISHAEGNATQASGNNSHAEGNTTAAVGKASHAEGLNTVAEGDASHSEGYSSIASAEAAHAEGSYTTAEGSASHAEGQYTTTRGFASHAEGLYTVAEGEASHSEGFQTRAFGDYSYAEGMGTYAQAACTHVQGKFNMYDGLRDYAHIVGNGHDAGWQGNAYSLDWTGNAVFGGTVSGSGADYAEYFEWADGNPSDEDRVGFIVTLDGDKIRPANNGDDILGVVSGTAMVIGDNAEWEWKNKYLCDDYGRVITEMVEEFVETVNSETGETEKKSLGFFPHRKLNPEYDPEQKYLRRDQRPEWDTVGLVGKLHVTDDGSCVVGGYATVGKNGIATASTDKTNMRVMKRITENIVLVFMK